MTTEIPSSQPAPPDDGGPAFPLVAEGHEHILSVGLTLRDYFAAKAMAALILHANDTQDVKNTPVAAYAVADAMLKARGGAA